MNPFAGEAHVLLTHLSPEECRERIEARAATTAAWHMWPSTRRSVVGRVSEHGFTLRRSIGYRNSFQTVASGELRQDEQGTKVAVAFGPSEWVVYFTLLWLSMVAIFASVGFSILDLRAEGLVALLAPLGMLAFGATAWAFGRWLARDEKAFLLRFLRETLQAQDGKGASA